MLTSEATKRLIGAGFGREMLPFVTLTGRLLHSG